jgi:hypothetical protein
VSAGHERRREQAPAPGADPRGSGDQHLLGDGALPRIRFLTEAVRVESPLHVSGECRSIRNCVAGLDLFFTRVIVGDHAATFDSKVAVNNPDQIAIRTYGLSHRTKWITIHDTAVDSNTPFNANTLAKAAGGTPFKRPEHGVFRPGRDFREFFFDETGDTTSSSVENETAGGWCSIARERRSTPGSSST